MYFNPYYIGFAMGALCAVAFIFLVLLVSAIISENRNRRNRK
jgi:hypothetical protein